MVSPSISTSACVEPSAFTTVPFVMSVRIHTSNRQKDQMLRAWHWNDGASLTAERAEQE
jgi:hypothetical protein